MSFYQRPVERLRPTSTQEPGHVRRALALTRRETTCLAAGFVVGSASWLTLGLWAG